MRVLLRILVGPAIVVGYVAMTGGECGGDIVDYGETVPLTVRLVNGEAQAVHIFGPDETFPCCQVVADGERSWVQAVEEGERVQFQAGRNGEIIGSVTCTVDESYDPPHTASVIWTGVGMGCGQTW